MKYLYIHNPFSVGYQVLWPRYWLNISPPIFVNLKVVDSTSCSSVLSPHLFSFDFTSYSSCPRGCPPCGACPPRWNLPTNVWFEKAAGCQRRTKSPVLDCHCCSSFLHSFSSLLPYSSTPFNTYYVLLSPCPLLSLFCLRSLSSIFYGFYAFGSNDPSPIGLDNLNSNISIFFIVRELKEV